MVKILRNWPVWKVHEVTLENETDNDRLLRETVWPKGDCKILETRTSFLRQGSEQRTFGLEWFDKRGKGRWENHIEDLFSDTCIKSLIISNFKASSCKKFLWLGNRICVMQPSKSGDRDGHFSNWKYLTLYLEGCVLICRDYKLKIWNCSHLSYHSTFDSLLSWTSQLNYAFVLATVYTSAHAE